MDSQSYFCTSKLTVFTQILQKLSKATDAIAAHFRFRSIAVVDSHREVVFPLYLKQQKLCDKNG